MFSLLFSLISWVGAILLVVGIKLIGDKKISGFYLATFAEVLWIVWGIFTGSWALVVMSAVFIIMYARAVYKWKNDASGVTQ